MPTRTFSDLIKRVANEIHGNPERHEYVRINCTSEKSFEELFAFIWGLEEAHRFLKPPLLSSEKWDKRAHRMRKSGDLYFQKKDFENALRLYNLSIMNALHPVVQKTRDFLFMQCESTEFPFIDPKNYGGVADGDCKTLALTYASRSAILFEMKHYEKCIDDINLAFEYGYPDDHQSKLDDRMAKCLLHLNKEDKSPVETAESEQLSTGAADVATEEEETEGATGGSSDLSDKMTSWLEVPQLPAKTSALELLLADKRKRIPQFEPNSSFPTFADSVKVTFVPFKGRRLLAKRDINPGEVMGLEEAVSFSINPSKLHLYCLTCARMCLTPLPCPSCTEVIFCSEHCRLKGLAKDHWLECRILPTLISLDLTSSSLVVKMLKTLSYKKMANIIDNLRRDRSDKQGDASFTSEELYFSKSFSSIHRLCMDTGRFSFQFLFTQCEISFILTHLLIQSGRFFVNENGNPVNPSREAIIKTGAVLLSHAVKMHFSPFQILDFNLKEPIGAGIFPAFSLLSHSCYPSLRHYNCDRKRILRAMRPIMAGEELTVSYTSEFQKLTRKERRRMLEDYKISCDCEACKKKWPTFIDLPTVTFVCLFCKTLLEGQLRLCSKCQVKFSEKEAKEILKDHQEEIDKITDSMVKSLSLIGSIGKGIQTTKDDFNFVCETIKLLYKHSKMPCKQILGMQKLLYKCFGDEM